MKAAHRCTRVARGTDRWGWAREKQMHRGSQRGPRDREGWGEGFQAQRHPLSYLHLYCLH